MKTIFCCACGGVPRLCRTAYTILFQDEPPELYKKERIRQIIEKLPKESEAYRFVDTTLKKKGRYGFYLEYDESGRILDCWNLLKQRRVE